MKAKDFSAIAAIIFISANAWAIGIPLLTQIDVDQDGAVDNVSLQFEPTNEPNQYHATLQIISNGRAYSKFLEDWFSPDLTQLSVLKIGQGIRVFIVVSTATGAHSERSQIFGFTAKGIEMMLSVSSDAPSIEEEDRDGNGILEIVAKQRDYERDPTIDSHEIVYKWDGIRFIEVK